MTLPRVRFTVRWMMVVVAIVALLLLLLRDLLPLFSGYFYDRWVDGEWPY